MSAPHDTAAHSIHPVNTTTPANPPLKGDATAAHPPPQKPDPTLESNGHGATQGGLTTPRPSAAAELASLKSTLKSSLRQFENFPEPGILFEDILPIFANPELHEGLLRGLELSVEKQFGATGKPDVVVGLDARGFLFGPSLALRLGASFVPVRKRGKLPGPCETAEYQKEYGSDFFQMQADAVKSGQKVLIVDDIIATGMLTCPLYKSCEYDGIYADTDYRWLCIRCWISRQQTRWNRHGLPFHSRTRLLEGSR